MENILMLIHAVQASTSNGFELQDGESVAQILTALFALLGLFYTGRQLKIGARANRAQFWLNLRQQFHEHRDIHARIMNGEWSSPESRVDEEDRSAVVAYMGLLEHCELMLHDKLLDIKTFDSIYGYRLEAILENPVIIRDTLIIRRVGWLHFVDLTRRFYKSRKHGRRLVPRERYLCGFRVSEERIWILWWGYPDLQEGAEKYEFWDDLQSAYFQKFTELQRSHRPLSFAWLKKDGITVHTFPLKSLQPPQPTPALPSGSGSASG